MGLAAKESSCMGACAHALKATTRVIHALVTHSYLVCEGNRLSGEARQYLTIVHVDWKAFLTCEGSCSEPSWAPSYPIPSLELGEVI